MCLAKNNFNLFSCYGLGKQREGNSPCHIFVVLLWNQLNKQLLATQFDKYNIMEKYRVSREHTGGTLVAWKCSAEE